MEKELEKEMEEQKEEKEENIEIRPTADIGNDEDKQQNTDAKSKELIYKRIATFLLLAYSFESDSDYPREFYQKLAHSNTYRNINKPFDEHEMKLFNQLLKYCKESAEKRIRECSGF